MGGQAIHGAARGQFFFIDPQRVTLIGRDTKHRAGEHPLYDERVHEEPKEALVRNVHRRGVRVAVVVRKNGKHTSGPYKGDDVLEVADGRNRTMACRYAAKRAREAGEEPPLLKIELQRGSDLDAVGVMIEQNEFRKADNLLIKARKAQRILALGRSEEEVAEMFGGRSVKTLRRWLQLTELADEVQTAIEVGKLSASAAIGLVELSREEQVARLPGLIERGGADDDGEGMSNGRGHGRNGKAPKLQPLVTKSRLKKLAADVDWMGGLSGDATALVLVILGHKEAVRQVPGLAERLGLC